MCGLFAVKPMLLYSTLNDLCYAKKTAADI